MLIKSSKKSIVKEPGIQNTESRESQDRICDIALSEVANGYINSLSVIYRTYGKMIYSVAYQILSNTENSEDVLQEVMIKIAQKAVTYQKGTNPRAWIITITRNLAIDKLKFKDDYTSIDELDDNEIPEKLICDNIPYENSLFIEEALKILSPEDRLIVKLKIYVKLSHAEIASIIGVTEDCAQKRYERAIGKIRRYFK